ncbi:MAG: hypothetical protein WC342_08060 [Methanoregula sp.]|jgi:hypothetical protein
MFVLVQNSAISNISNGSIKSSINSFLDEIFVEYCSATPPIVYENSKSFEEQIKSFFATLKAKMSIQNEEELISYFCSQSTDIDEVIEPFLYINKIVEDKFPEKHQIYVHKYDDPETEDHFIAIDIRQNHYPDGFINKIWEVRKDFSKKYSNNGWILISTDYNSIS